MHSMKEQGGIQMLLNAEQEAQSIVSEAKNLKLVRLKQAKEEAEREVKPYRSQLEADYQRTISESSGSSGLNVKRLEEETEAKINNFKDSSPMVSKDHANQVCYNCKSMILNGEAGLYTAAAARIPVSNSCSHRGYCSWK